MAEIRYNGKSVEQRIADRLKNSGGDLADHHTVHGTGPTRVHHNIHNHGQGGQPRRVDLGRGGVHRSANEKEEAR